MVRRKLALGLIDTDAGIQFVDIDKKTIAYHDRNSDVITFKYVDGWKRSFSKSMPDKAFRVVKVPSEHCFFFPGGKDNGVLKPDKVEFVLGICNLINESKIFELAEEKILAIRLKQERDKFKKEKEELENEYKKLQRQFAMLK